jgi:hypothetical protein
MGLLWLVNGVMIVELHRDRAILQTESSTRHGLPNSAASWLLGILSGFDSMARICTTCRHSERIISKPIRGPGSRFATFRASKAIADLTR